MSGPIPPLVRLRLRQRRVPPTLAAALFAALLVAGCGGGSPEPGADRSPLVLGYKADLQTLNPLVSTDQNANDVLYHLLHTPLVRYDSSYRIRPWLARSWELGDSSVVFHLRDDVRWHDGEPVTAEDVAFTYRRARDPATASPLGAVYLQDVSSVEVLGPHTVRFGFAPGRADPLQDFYWPPVPEHLLGSVPPSGMATHPYGREPVGSGPFRLTSWRPGVELRFRAVEEFPAGLGGTPGIERVVYRILPEATTRLRELLRGELHVDGPLAPRHAERVERAPGVRVESFPWRQFVYMGWNTRDPRLAGAEVRRALTLAIDRPGLLAAALHGRGRVATGVIPPWHPYHPDLAPLPHDPDSARTLLAANGWIDRDGDGVRERGGRRLRLTLLSSRENELLSDLAQMIQAQMTEVGVALEPRLLEWQTVLSRHRRREFEVVLTDWILDHFRVDPRPLFHSRQARREGSANRSSYSSPVADSLMELGIGTRDPARAARIWEEFSRVLQWDQPFTFLFWKDEVAGVSHELSGVRMDARGELATLPGWEWRSGSEARVEASASRRSGAAETGARGRRGGDPGGEGR